MTDRNLDVWIAENVMGLSDFYEEPNYKEPRYYSTNIYDAWEVVEELSAEGVTVQVRQIEGMLVCNCKLFRYYRILICQTLVDTAPKAICLAAYKLKTGKDWEDVDEPK